MKTRNYLPALICCAGLWLLAACSNPEDKDRKKMQEELEAQRKELSELRQSSSKANETLADKFDHVHKSVVMIMAEGEEEQSQGSGIIINEEGDAISNFHVFQNSKRAYAIDADGRKYPITKIYRFSEDDDYIFFKIGSGTQKFQPATIATALPKIGAGCFTVSNPRGLEQTLSNGIISAFRDDNRVIQNTANITHGSSGGALFNDQGEVIGITTKGVIEDNLFFAINIEKLPLANYKNDFELTTEASTASVDQGDGVAAIKTFLLAEEHRNLGEILSCFSSNMYRYWDLQPPSQAQLANRYRHSWSITENAVNDLKDIRKIDEHTYVYTVDFTYFSIKDQAYKTVNNARVQVVFDDSYKIVAIFGA
ncbi:S1 family peptidase [Taibaiella koreensis]|uniref:S1 family peptidase n=1 Tax=Taibaiella koreensis TaxID=1268548 RepID=UPI000E59F19A|nr:serine protease [Taibaiella koreensis]